jgi:hypothetical protein
MKHTAFLLALALLSASPALALEFDVQALGLGHVPFKVGEAVTAERFAGLDCQDHHDGLFMCSKSAPGKPGFGVFIQDLGDGPRIASILSYWECEPSACSQAFSDTVAELSRKMGAQPEMVEGAAIWRDREKQRELAVFKMDTNLIGVSLSRK